MMGKSPANLPHQLIKQVPPHSLELEQHILGSVIKKPALWVELDLVEQDFYSPAHRAIYRAVQALDQKGSPLDLVTLLGELKAQGSDGAAGGPAYLAGLTETVAAPSHAFAWAKDLRGYTQRRITIEMAMDVASKAFDLQQDPEEVLYQAHATLDQLNAAGGITRAQWLRDLVHPFFDHLERLKDAGTQGVLTGFYKLDRLTAGILPGEMCCLAARPGNGKTALALNVAEYNARKFGRSVGIFSLEMVAMHLLGRFCSTRAEVNAQRFRDGKFSEEEWGRLYTYAEKLQELPIRIYDKPMVKPGEFRAECRRWKRDGGLDLLVVDYLQLMSPDQRGASREREISEISRAIKGVAAELEVPVMVLSQLNREAEKAKTPLLSHLRESGSIEQDSDQVWFFKFWDPAKTAGDVVDVSMIVAKGRGNATGELPLVYRRKYLRFENPVYDPVRGG